MMMNSLQHRWERVRTVPGLGRDVTAVLSLVIAAAIAAVILQGKMSVTFPWSSRTVLRVEFASVPGVNPQSSHKVTIAGVTVGKITGWEPTAQGDAILTLTIEPGHKFYSNARAVLSPKNPLNDMTVDINPGGPPGTPLPQNGLIPMSQTSTPVQADAVLSHLDERTQLAVTDLLTQSAVALDHAPQQLPAGANAVHSTLLKLAPVVDALQTRRAKIAELVTALAQISHAIGQNDTRSAALVNATQQTLSVLANNDGALRATLEQLPGLTGQLRSALVSTTRLTGQLNPTLDGLGAAANSLPDTLARFRGTVDQVGKTVDSARPFIADANPFIADLRPLIANLNPSLTDLLPVSASLDQATTTVTNYATDIQAFVYNTTSVFGAGDTAETGIIRGHLVVPLPGGGLLPGGHGGYAPGPEDGLGGTK